MCVTAVPDQTECSVTKDGGLVMQSAPCPSAPAVKVGNNQVIIPTNASFQFLDVNSRQTSACGQYGYSPEDNTTCWVQGTYQGVTAWVAVAQGAGGNVYTDPMCAYDREATEQEWFVTANVSSFTSKSSCAMITGDLECFPGSSSVVLPGGQSVAMTELKLGDEVGVCLSPDQEAQG